MIIIIKEGTYSNEYVENEDTDYALEAAMELAVHQLHDNGFKAIDENGLIVNDLPFVDEDILYDRLINKKYMESIGREVMTSEEATCALGY